MDDLEALAIRLIALEFIVQKMIFDSTPSGENPVAFIERKRDEMVSHLNAGFLPSENHNEEIGQMKIAAVIDLFWESCAKRAAVSGP